MTKIASTTDSELLATGEATFAQLARLFRTDAKTIPQRMRGVMPVGKRGPYRVYNIREAAGRLVEPGYEIEQYIRQMSPQELPPLLQKEFWNGQKARLSYEKEMGNLWPTGDVVELAGVLEQGIRQAILLVTDEIEREEGFTDGQRKVFRRKMDEAITTLKEHLTEKFKDYYADREENGGQTGPQPLVGSSSDSRGVLDSEEDEEVDI